MSFTWPFALLGLLSVPLVAGIYLLVIRRRHRQAVTYSNLALLRAAVPRTARWKRHLPIAVLLGSLALLAIASARPQVTSNVPIAETSIILALDDSGSMCSTDVAPNRLAAAQTAAREFVDSQPKGVRMGLVVFSGFAELVVPPTTDHAPLDAAIENLDTNPGTAIGAAILQSLDAISEINPAVAPIGNALELGAGIVPGEGGFVIPPPGTPVTTTTTTLPPKPGTHGYAPDIIVLMTDGSNNRGIAPLDAVPYAVSRGVRVYTIGFGTTHPSALMCTPAQHGGQIGQAGFGAGGAYGGGGFGGGYGGGIGLPGGQSPLVADLPTLQKVAKETGAASFAAKNESQLSTVFKNLPKVVAVQKEHHEISSTFVLLAALMALAAIGASIRWSPYP